jgi:16S rRNA (guanine527-N7)-methyltransferase
MTQLVTVLNKLSLDAALSSKLERFRDLFLRWNERINLSAASNAAEVEEHIRDSLHAVPHLHDAQTVIDVGSGGGFPVVIAAICLPSAQFTALEPVHKKHAFLRTAARELGLANLSAFARRVEDHPDRDHDAATSRATFDLREWLLRGRELVRVGGRVLGFEATLRTDLPAPFERYPYELDGKQRAIIVATRRS